MKGETVALGAELLLAARCQGLAAAAQPRSGGAGVGSERELALHGGGGEVSEG